MKRTTRILVSLAILFSPLAANAGCDLDYQVCEKTCKIKNLTDEGAQNGCITKCAAEKGVCLAKEGAEKTAELGEEAWDNTQSFFKALTED